MSASAAEIGLLTELQNSQKQMCLVIYFMDMGEQDYLQYGSSLVRKIEFFKDIFSDFLDFLLYTILYFH